jgi:hypothetical protein
VLFLRRFGYAPGMDAVTVAAVGSLGRSWRLVTLDDAQAAPVGVSPRTEGTHAVLNAGRTVGSAVIEVPAFIANAVCICSFWGAVILLGYVYYQHPNLKVGHLYQHPGAYGAAASLVRPLLAAALASGLVLAFLMLARAIILMVMYLPASYLASVEATRRLMGSARQEGIQARSDIARVATELLVRSHRGSSARLWIVRVDSALWQETVLHLARRCQRILIDVSEPSSNVAWEIAQVTAFASSKCVFVGTRERVNRLVGTSAEHVGSDLDRQLLGALDGHTVIAYGDGDPAFCQSLATALRWGL